jgi:exosortase
MLSAAPPSSSAPAVNRLSFVRGTAAVSLLLVGAFWLTWSSYPSVWLDNRTHGFLAAGLTIWVLWVDRDRLLVEPSPVPPAAALIAAFSLLWLAGIVVSAQVVHQFALPAILWSWLLTIRGVAAARAAAPAAAAFALALPIWEVLTWPLQLVATSVSGTVVRALGVEAVIKDETITIAAGRFIVADSCSGLGFFLTAVSLGLTYALLFTKSFGLRWRIVALAAALALVANWVRVIGLVLIGNATRMTSPLMEDHELFGWVIFAVAMALLFLLAGRLERSQRLQKTERSMLASGDALSTEPSTTGPSWLLPATTAAVLAGPLLLLGVRLMPNALQVSEQIPGIVAGDAWAVVDSDVVTSSQPILPGVWRPAFAGQDIHRRVVWRQERDSVVVDRLVFRSEHQGAELVGGANRVAPDSAVLQDGSFGPLDASSRIVRQAIVRENGRAVLVWYWYRVAGVATSSATKAKLLGLVAFFRRSEGGEAVFVSTSCDGGACADAAARLFRFVTGRSLPTPSR